MAARLSNVYEIVCVNQSEQNKGMGPMVNLTKRVPRTLESGKAPTWQGGGTHKLTGR